MGKIVADSRGTRHSLPVIGLTAEKDLFRVPVPSAAYGSAILWTDPSPLPTMTVKDLLGSFRCRSFESRLFLRLSSF